MIMMTGDRTNVISDVLLTSNSASCYEVKHNLRLFERPLKENKDDKNLNISDTDNLLGSMVCPRSTRPTHRLGLLCLASTPLHMMRLLS